MSENLELMAEIAKILVNNEEMSGVDWDELSVVFTFDDEGDVNDTYGYAYDKDDEWTAISFRPRDVRPQ
jgi:hypothetical protein